MKKYLFVFFLTLPAGFVFAQLQIGSGTSWRSDPITYVVLNNTGIQYDAATAQFTNIFKFTGNADVTIAGSNLPIFTKIELAKTGAAKVSLQRSINLTQSLNFQGGLFDLGNAVLNMGANALLLNESETSRMMGADGYARIVNNLNAPNAVNPGNLGAVITSSADLGSVTIYRGVKQQVNSGGIGSSVLRFYEIVPTNNTGLNAILHFNYFDAELNGLAESNLVLYKSDDNVTWSAQGYSNRDVALNFVEQTGINDFSRWTLSTPGNPLPVSFLLFSIKCEGNKNSIAWKTAQPVNLSHFEVQRSEDGVNWVTLNLVVPAGNNSSEQNYLYTDYTTIFNTTLYRIAAVDNDGRIKYTGINRSSCAGAPDIWKTWPNPVQQTLWISLQSAEAGDATIKLFDSKGSLVSARQQSISNGNNLLEINMEKFTSGTYYLQVQWGSRKQIRLTKVIKQ